MASRPSRARVAWVAEIPVPYRMGLYRRLRVEREIDLRLIFCARTQADRDWQVSLEDTPHVFLTGSTTAVRPREQFYLRANPGIWRELSRVRPDVVVVAGYAHLTMQWAMLWCRLTRTPYLINSESHHGHGRAGWLRAVKRLPVGFFVRGAAGGLPTGSAASDYLVSYGGRADRMYRLPNTCDVGRFAVESDRVRAHRDDARASLGLGGGPVLLFVGRLTSAKGVDLLLHAFARMGSRAAATIGAERPSLLIVGDGEQRAELESLAVTLDISDRVVFAGSRVWEELPALYAAADLFVLPSRFEPWGAVVNEALACGLPVVASDRVGCAPDLVRPGENGWIVPGDDIDALADALDDATSDAERLAAMSAASRQMAWEWSEEMCLDSLEHAICAVLDDPQRTARHVTKASRGRMA